MKAEDFPDHKCGLYLTHNIHKDYYTTVAKLSADINRHEIDEGDWGNDVEKTLALLLDEVWTLQWYPDTPIGSYSLAAYNLSALLEAARTSGQAGE